MTLKNPLPPLAVLCSVPKSMDHEMKAATLTRAAESPECTLILPDGVVTYAAAFVNVSTCHRLPDNKSTQINVEPGSTDDEWLSMVE